MFYLSQGLTGVIVLVAIIVSVVIIGAISFIIYKTTHPKLKEDKPNEEQILQEEMDRMLKPIEDEEVAKEIEQYKEKEDE